MTPIIASILSTLLANNLPKVAQAVVDKGLDYVQEKTGIELKPDMSPQEVQALREAAQRHEEFRIEQDNKNTADARSLQKAALQQDDLISKRFIYVLAAFWSIFSAVYIGFITFGTIPEANVRFADTILGFLLGTMLGMILNFFFGSSSGSARKNTMLEDVLAKLKP
jgi:hypothetical protein